MELIRVREILAGTQERRTRLPSPEENARVERYREIGCRIIALAPDSLALGNEEIERGAFTERHIGIAIPESSEGAGDALGLGIKLTYALLGSVGFPDSRIDRLVEINASWWDADDPLLSITEELKYHRLHEVPEDTIVSFQRMEQTLDSLSPYLYEDGQIDSSYLL